MGIYEQTIYEVVCDGEGCFESATETTTETRAKRNAREEGFVERGGKWLCERCARKAGKEVHGNG